jgi:hypothetical protein
MTRLFSAFNGVFEDAVTDNRTHACKLGGQGATFCSNAWCAFQEVWRRRCAGRLRRAKPDHPGQGEGSTIEKAPLTDLKITNRLVRAAAPAISNTNAFILNITFSSSKAAESRQAREAW